jgi:GST-like protein
LAQSNAIMFYAVDHDTPGALLSLGGSDRARALERYFYFLTDIIAFSQTAFFLSSQGETTGATVLEARLIERLDISERFLSEGCYMAGDESSLADIAAFTIALAYRGRLDWRTGRPLVQWFAQIEARRAVMRGLQSFRSLKRERPDFIDEADFQVSDRFEQEGNARAAPDAQHATVTFAETVRYPRD